MHTVYTVPVCEARGCCLHSEASGGCQNIRMHFQVFPLLPSTVDPIQSVTLRGGLAEPGANSASSPALLPI